MADIDRVRFIAALLGPLHAVVDIDEQGRARVWVAPPLVRAWLKREREERAA